MPTEEEIAAARAKHPSHWDEVGDKYVAPIELHPGVEELPSVQDDLALMRKLIEDREVKRLHKPKGLRIVEECEATGEPYFVFRAKDVLSTFILAEYFRLLELYRPTNMDMAEAVAKARTAFVVWMDENPTAVHLPD